MTKTRRLAVLALLAVTLIWGATLPIVKPVFDVLSISQFLYARYAVATIFSLPVLLILKKPSLSVSKWIKILALEFFGTPIILTILYMGVEQTSALESSLIGAMSPLFTIIGGVWFLHEKESRREWQGFAIALLGTLILVFEPMLAGGSVFSGSFLGNSLILLYNILWTAYLLIAKKLYRSVPKLLVGAVGNVVGLVSFGAYLLVTRSIPSISILTTDYTPFPILYMGILGSLVAVSLYLYGQNKIEASEASIYTYLQPLVAIPTAYLILQEVPTVLNCVAMLVIAVGVYRAEFKKM